jgi:hypothetical protein
VKKKFFNKLSVLIIIIDLLACSQDSGGSSLDETLSGGTLSSALASDGALTATAPSSASVVQTSTQLSNSLASPLIATKEAIQALDLLAQGTSPYETDIAYEETNDPTKNIFQFLSDVLKVTSVTGYDYVYDKGPVKTVFDWNAATNNTGQGKYMVEAWVDSKLTSGNLPLIAEIWIPVKNQDLDIKLIITAAEAPSPTNRFGKFKVNLYYTMQGQSGGALFEVDTNDQGLPTISLKEKLATSVGYYSSGGSSGESINFNAILGFNMAAEGVVNDKTGTGEVSYNRLVTVLDNKGDSSLTNGQDFCKDSGIVTINKDYVYYKSSAEVIVTGVHNNVISSVCASDGSKLYARANPTRIAESYGLYNRDTKERVNLRTGIRVEQTGGDGLVYEGWLSEYGLWMHPYAPPADYDWSQGSYKPADGSTLTEVGYDGTRTDYTAEIRDFSIDKNTTLTIPFSDLEGVELKNDTRIIDGVSSPTLDNTRKDVIIKYDKSTNKFMRVKKCNQSDHCWQSSQFVDITPEEHIRYFENWDCSNNPCTRKLLGLVYDFNDNRLEVKKIYNIGSGNALTADADPADNTPASNYGLNYSVDYWLQSGFNQNTKDFFWSTGTPNEVEMVNRETINKTDQAIKLVSVHWNNSIPSKCYNSYQGSGSVTFLNSSTDANSKTEVFKNHTYMLDTKLRLYKCASYTDSECINESKRIAKIAYDVNNNGSSQVRCTSPANTSGCRSSDWLDGLVPDSEVSAITLTSFSDQKQCNSLEPYSYSHYKFNWGVYNELYGLKKSDGTYLSFDLPLNFTSVIDGKAVNLTYYGFDQQLSEMTCDNNGNCSPEVSYIPDGTELVYKSGGVETTFLTKALFVIENLTDVTGSDPVPAELVKSPSSGLSYEFTQPTYREKPTATKVCAVDGKPVDSDGTPLESITGANAAKFCN